MWEYNYLEHHGILGQKWGVRRFQNRDGTLTKAGRDRLGMDRVKLESKEYSYKKRKSRKRTERVLATLMGPLGLAAWYSSPAAIKDDALFKIAKRRLSDTVAELQEKYYVRFNDKKKRYEIYESESSADTDDYYKRK